MSFLPLLNGEYRRKLYSMNRRNFIKTTSGAIASLPFISTLLGQNAVSDELQDLYSFMESKLIDGKPFKLYPFQKEILKTIHENNRVVIVKARQIGMTTLFAGYDSWLIERSNVINRYSPPNSEMCECYIKLVRQFSDKISSGISVRSEGRPTGLLYDECNYCEDFERYVRSDSKRFRNAKIVIAGTPDNEGRLKKFVDTHPDYVIKHYPATKCMVLWKDHRRAYYATYWGDHEEII